MGFDGYSSERKRTVLGYPVFRLKGGKQMIIIKPHHFLDVIKLYGKGIERFVPDEEYNHNFYSVANEIISNHQVPIQIALGEDDICSPCKYLDENGICIDKIDHIIGICSKDEFNKILDNRIIALTKVSEKSQCSAEEFCRKLYSIKENIFDIWKEETETAQKNRYDAFCAGAEKYLALF